ncbi:hypothetical protein I4U23_028837 [Adineta vaga]|nr:hypothetical protein I4U23_028837 [Adineta vaga]
MKRTKQCCFSFCGTLKDFVLGTAFSNVIQSLVDDIMTPPLGLVLGGVDFINLTIKMPNFIYKDQPPVVIRYGRFIQALITLVIGGLSLLGILKSIYKLYRIASEQEQKSDCETANEVREEVKLLREIRDILARSSQMESVDIQL